MKQAVIFYLGTATLLTNEPEELNKRVIQFSDDLNEISVVVLTFGATFHRDMIHNPGMSGAHMDGMQSEYLYLLQIYLLIW